MGSVHDLTQEGKGDRIGIAKLPPASWISVCNLKPITAQAEVGGIWWRKSGAKIVNSKTATVCSITLNVVRNCKISHKGRQIMAAALILIIVTGLI